MLTIKDESITSLGNPLDSPPDGRMAYVRPLQVQLVDGVDELVDLLVLGHGMTEQVPAEGEAPGQAVFVASLPGTNLDPSTLHR